MTPNEQVDVILGQITLEEFLKSQDVTEDKILLLLLKEGMVDVEQYFYIDKEEEQ